MSAPSGSSPRMRGSRQLIDELRQILGIIPAHAGLTSGQRLDEEVWRDHPRACGAHSNVRRNNYEFLGSSPRMRGSHSASFIFSPPSWIIPAHAGLTLLREYDVVSGRDHPRACGAHLLRFLRKLKKMGSSPRMRGSPDREAGRGTRDGIIPAHAGLTSGKCSKKNLHRDHPRACGAHFLLGFLTFGYLGSSPRMRGSL